MTIYLESNESVVPRGTNWRQFGGPGPCDEFESRVGIPDIFDKVTLNILILLTLTLVLQICYAQLLFDSLEELEYHCDQKA